MAERHPRRRPPCPRPRLTTLLHPISPVLVYCSSQSFFLYARGLQGRLFCSFATHLSAHSHHFLTGTLNNQPPPATQLILLASLLPLLLYTSFLTPVQVTGLVSASKHALFPNGYPAQSPPDPTPEEQAVLRSELVQRLAQTIPGSYLPFCVDAALKQVIFIHFYSTTSTAVAGSDAVCTRTETECSA